MRTMVLMGNPEKQIILDAVAEDSDASLVRRFQSGDTSAFDELVTKHQSYVYNLCLQMLGNPSDAEDAAQEAFLGIYRGLARFRMNAKVSTWIYRIATNQCMSHWRKRQELPVEIDIEDHSSGFEEAEKRRSVKHLIGQLPPHYRAVLVLKYYRELSYEEIADILGWSVAKVKCYLHRARNIFKKKYEEHEDGGLL